MDVKQIKPNHCDHISGYKEKYLNEMFANEFVVAQPKYDGERMLIHLENDEVACTSRRISKKTNKFMQNEDKLPELVSKWKEISATHQLGYTILDCECYQKDWSTIVGILHSLPERATKLCELNPPKYSVFDCLWFDGECLMDVPYITRLKYAKRVVEMFNWPQMHLVKFMNDDLMPDTLTHCHFVNSIEEEQTAMQNAIALGFEGIVIKSLQRKYFDVGASLKCKKFETVDVVVYDYVQGNGKYSDTVGALSIGYYDPATQSIKQISQVNCGTDDERNVWRDNWAQLKNSVIEVKCQEVTEKSLRHPVYIRRRDDKDYTTCTKDTIFKEE